MPSVESQKKVDWTKLLLILAALALILPFIVALFMPAK